MLYVCWVGIADEILNLDNFDFLSHSLSVSRCGEVFPFFDSQTMVRICFKFCVDVPCVDPY